MENLRLGTSSARCEDSPSTQVSDDFEEEMDFEVDS